MGKRILCLSGYSRSGPSAIHLSRFDCIAVVTKTRQLDRSLSCRTAGSKGRLSCAITDTLRQIYYCCCLLHPGQMLFLTPNQQCHSTECTVEQMELLYRQAYHHYHRRHPGNNIPFPTPFHGSANRKCGFFLEHRGHRVNCHCSLVFLPVAL